MYSDLAILYGLFAAVFINTGVGSRDVGCQDVVEFAFGYGLAVWNQGDFDHGGGVGNMVLDCVLGLTLCRGVAGGFRFGGNYVGCAWRLVPESF